MEDESVIRDSNVSQKLEKLFKNAKKNQKRNRKEQKKSARKHDISGDTLVTYRLCLETECRLDNIIKHVKAKHGKFWRTGANRASFIAQ